MYDSWSNTLVSLEHVQLLCRSSLQILWPNIKEKQESCIYKPAIKVSELWELRSTLGYQVETCLRFVLKKAQKSDVLHQGLLTPAELEQSKIIDLGKLK